MAYRRAAALIGAALLAGCAPFPPGSAQCAARPLAVLPIATTANDWSVVAVQLDGQPVRMVIDTGASFSVISEATASRLGLERTPVKIRGLIGVGGISRRLAAIARHMRLGDLLLDDQRLEVADISVGLPRAPVDGLLGSDILSAYDTDLDLRHATLTLNAPAGCAAPPPGWGPAMRVPVGRPYPTNHLMTLPVRLDGHALTAIIDTGASGSILGAAAAQRAGVAAAQPGDKAVELGGIGSDHPAAFRHRFQSLSFGGGTFIRPSLLVGPVEAYYDMILGADFLRFFRAWIPADAQAIWLAAPTAQATPAADPSRSGSAAASH